MLPAEASKAMVTLEGAADFSETVQCIVASRASCEDSHMRAASRGVVTGFLLVDGVGEGVVGSGVGLPGSRRVGSGWLGPSRLSALDFDLPMATTTAVVMMITRTPVMIAMDTCNRMFMPESTPGIIDARMLGWPLVSQNPYEQQFPPPAPAYPAYPGMPAQPQKTNGFAIASLIFGIIGGVLLSAIFGIIALVQIKKNNEKGKGMAIAGLVLSGAWVAVICIAVLAVALFQGTKTPSSSSLPTPVETKETSVKVETLRAGDCVNGLQEGDIARLPAISCDQPHEGEVVGDYQVSGTDYPGEKSITDEANEKCNDLLLKYSPSTKDDETIGLFFVYPTTSTWSRGDRQVLCIAEHTEGKKSGSIKG